MGKAKKDTQFYTMKMMYTTRQPEPTMEYKKFKLK